MDDAKNSTRDASRIALIRPVKLWRNVLQYDQFVNFRFLRPSTAGGDFAVCLHYSALVDCPRDSTCVAVASLPLRKPNAGVKQQLASRMERAKKTFGDEGKEAS
jgi:hypothetical protein